MKKKIVANMSVLAVYIILLSSFCLHGVKAADITDNGKEEVLSDKRIENPIPDKMSDEQFFWHAGGTDAYEAMMLFDEQKEMARVNQPNSNNIIIDDISEKDVSSLPVEELLKHCAKQRGAEGGLLDDNDLLRGMMSVTFVTNSAGDYGFFSGELWHEQDYWYYCGPASVANALEIINGTSNSQSTYATYMGTTSSNGTAVHMVVSAMNNYQSTNSYGYRSIGTDYSRLWDPIITDTETNNVPCIVMLYTDCLDAYNGHKLNHFVLIRGFSNRNASDSSKKLYYTDSWNDSSYGNTTLGKKIDYLSNFMGGTTYLVW